MKPAARWQDNKPCSSLEKPLCIGSDALCRGKRKITHCHFEIKKMVNSGEIINYKNPINTADDALQNLPQSTASPTLASHQKQSPISSNKKVVGKRKWNLGWRQSLNGQKHQRPAVFPPGGCGGRGAHWSNIKSLESSSSFCRKTLMEKISISAALAHRQVKPWLIPLGSYLMRNSSYNKNVPAVVRENPPLDQQWASWPGCCLICNKKNKLEVAPEYESRAL